MGYRIGIAIACFGAVLLVSCQKAPPAAADTSEPAAPASIATIWPASLSVMGDGFPEPGDACRRLGESAATANFLDDSAILVGCPGGATDDAAAAILAKGGRAVGSEQNITLISIPQGDANVGMHSNAGSPAELPADTMKKGKPE